MNSPKPRSGTRADLTLDPRHPPLPATGERLRWGNLHGSSTALAVSNAARDHGGPVLVICTDTLAANRLEEELRFYTGASEDCPVLVLPDWETLPYDRFSPHQDITSRRLETLYRLGDLRQGLVIAPVSTLMHRLPPRSYLDAGTLMLEQGQRLDLERLRKRLEAGGYLCVPQVMEHGEFAVRGSLIDIYPMGSALPYRIDLFDEEVDTLRTFDPETQRSVDVVERIRLLPAREFPLDEAAVTRFRQAWRAAFAGDPSSCPTYQDVSQGIAPAGVEYHLPLFFETCATLFDYLPEETLVTYTAGVLTSAETFWDEAGERHEQLRHDSSHPLLPPARLFLQAHELFAALASYSRIEMHQDPLDPGAAHRNFATDPPPSLAVNRRAEQPLQRLAGFLDAFAGRVLLCAETAGRRESLLELLQQLPLQPRVCDSWQSFVDSEAQAAIAVAPLDQGILLPAGRLAVITESQLFGEQIRQRRRRVRTRERDSDAVVRDLTELRTGAAVVHEEHGVGRYLGLQVIQLGDQAGEFLTLEYAGGDKLYVPVSSLHLVSRYTGADPDQAPLHRLGSEQWQKARRKAAEQVRDVAAELLDLYARRAARKGHAFGYATDQYAAFAESFPFEETPDQEQAIESVLVDLRSPRPMDRLVCGDVGFGKTEVAMRAAFVAVQDGRQVAVLVPTTLLAQQHYDNFRDRFADWPVRIEVLSRFGGKRQQSEALEAVADGRADIVIGTHKLLQENVRFKRLGLVIIDEEHRFGVRQKERLKALRSEVDILTLTATPIPRTLNMAISGMRDLSIIATPPARRLSIKTFVRERNSAVIREAILREVLRGGQVYYLHNEVESIERLAREVEALVPEARVSIAHGQMRERELERVMSDFYHRRFNVLVCTTIIETGIDIPTANTIIMDRADKFGLAQMHQLRGRVGRSHHQAYAYLFTPPRRQLTPDAVKRLDAIEQLEDLGAGFALATHDLEIRGAGELLGEGQSGNMQAVGFGLYMEMLERAVKALKEGREPELDKPFGHDAEVDLHLPAFIPEDYLPDVPARLTLYKRIANAADERALEELQVEMIDRFGLLPPQVKNLFRATRLKLKAQPLGILKLEAGTEGGRIEFRDQPDIDPMRIIELLHSRPNIYRLDGQTKLRFNMPLETADRRFAAVEELLFRLGRRDAA